METLKLGMVKNAADLLFSNLSSGAVIKGSTVRWGFFLPLEAGMREINELIEKGRIKPVIDSMYNFEEMRDAYKRISEGHLRGKVVVSHIPFKKGPIGMKPL